ncbi:MAG: Glycoside hydrolase 2 (Mannanase, beta-galactosidase) [Chaenotheca gracillima]|nr:MAG: Glycoside hydrolase 2 (Mannanase, beta-galactosidase) [Chaenotheca gracillima]
MELPRSCLTNAFESTGHSSIDYHIFTPSIAPSDDEDPYASFGDLAPPRLSPRQHLLKTFQSSERWCRNEGLLAYCDNTGLELWLFETGDRAGKVSELASTARADSGLLVTLNDGPTLHWRSSGNIKASMLAKSAPSPALPPEPASAPATAATFDQGNRANQVLNARAYQNNRSLSQPSAILQPELSAEEKAELEIATKAYSAFLIAVVSHLSYTLAKDQSCVPLNFRTFIPPKQEFGIESSALPFITLDAYLTTNGSLIISFTSTRQGSLCRLSEDGSQKAATDVKSKVSDLWLAPGGTVGRFEGYESFNNSSFASQPNGTEIRQWKSDVLEWLSERGINLRQYHYEEIDWLLVSVRTYPSSSAVQAGHRDVMTILWPMSLCFKKRSELEAWPPDEDGTSWFKTGCGEALEDPFAFAERWWLQRDEREALRKSRHEIFERDERRKAAEVKEQAQRDRDLISSPAASLLRVNNIGDIHAGVYPTPPDALPHGSDAGHPDGSEANTSNPLTQTTFADGSGTQEPHTQAQEEGDPFSFANGEEGPLAGTSGDNDFDMEPDNGGGDDLFGDMDEDMFGEPGAEDPDFSFFDEPDVEGDVPMAQESATTAEPSDDRNDDGPNDEPNTSLAAILAMHEEAADVERDETAGDEAVDSAPANDANVETSSPTQVEAAPDGQTTTQQSTQVISPPLSPGRILERIIGSQPDPNFTESTVARVQGLIDQAAARRTSYPSNFGSVPFNSALDSLLKKYSTAGRFWFSYGDRHPESALTTGAGSSNSRPLPLVGFPPLVSRGSLQERLAASQGEDPSAEDETDSADDTDEVESSPSEDPESSSSSSSEEEEAPPSPRPRRFNFAPGTGNRKRKIEDVEDTTDSPRRPGVLTLIPLTPISIVSAVSWEALKPDPADWPLTELFRAFGNDHQAAFALNDKDFVDVAQIITDQLSSGGWHELEDRLHGRTFQPLMSGGNAFTVDIDWAVQGAFSNAARCNMDRFAAIEDVQSDPPGARAAVLPRPQPPKLKRAPSQINGADDNTQKPAITHISVPHVCLQRGDSRLELLPTALGFWEPFGFGPHGGVKNVSAFCVYPEPGVQGRDVDAFLDTMGSVYEGCRLGTHTRGSAGGYNSPLANPGHVPVNLGSGGAGDLQVSTSLQGIREACIRLGMMLSRASTPLDNVVIYLLNPYTHPGVMIDLCAAFLALYRSFIQSSNAQRPPMVKEIVLKIVPIAYVSSTTTIAVPTRLECTVLAMDVYERCVTTSGKEKPTPASSIVLGRTLPRRIDFKLTPEPSSSLLNENFCFHVAYSWSLDERWITAAWSDNRGELKNCASYCLQRRLSSPARPFRAIFRTIWETTIQLVLQKQVHCRVMIVKEGPMGENEVEAWKSFYRDTSSVPASLTLLTIDTDSFKLSPASLPRLPGPPTQQATAATYSTPVSTPQPPNTQSPEQHANTPGGMPITPGDTQFQSPSAAAGTANTPASTTEAVDADATVIDPSDETWSVTLSHRLRNSPSVIDFRPALASGLLIKRGDGIRPAVMGVNLVFTTSPITVNPSATTGQTTQKALDALLEEILRFYRGLNTLARWRGTVDPVAGVEPWHVAAAVKAQRALSFLT